jgi:DNA-binding transcriptional LysR family regulator
MTSRSPDPLWMHLHALHAVSMLGSFTAAAQNLRISKAAMSQRIAELEQATGAPLVRRTTRSVRLTEAGQQLVDSTRSSFEQIEQSLAAVKDLAQAPRGLLRVTAPVALGRQQIVPLLPTFLREHPALRIELELNDRLSSLAQEGFDLAIRHADSVPETHVAWVLCETRALLVASRDYLHRRGTPSTPQDLSTHDCLRYQRGGAVRPWSFEPIAGHSPRVQVAVQGSFAANNSEALREAALAGTGIALLPDFSAQRDVAAGTLVPVLEQWRSVTAFGASVYAVRPHSAQVPKSVQALVACLRRGLYGAFSLAAISRS